MSEHAVVIAGGGPTGMMLAAELTLAGVDVAIVERRASAELVGSRAGGLHARTIEVLDQRGIADRFLARGQGDADRGVRPRSRWTSAISDPAQLRARALAEALRTHPRRLDRRAGRPDLSRTRGDGLRAGRHRRRRRAVRRPSLRAKYLVGCDGGRSVVRKSSRASHSPAGIRPSATCSPRSSWPRNRSGESATTPWASMPSASSTRPAWCGSW